MNYEFGIGNYELLLAQLGINELRIWNWELCVVACAIGNYELRIMN